MKNKLCILAVVLAAVLAVGYALRDFFLPKAVEKNSDDASSIEQLSIKHNIVVLGVDLRPKKFDAGRSDTIFVVMLDPNKKNVPILNVPRDTRVWIDNHGWDKINHAYSLGGAELTKKTAEELLKLKLHNYVVVDFKGFAGLVDAIGGVDIEIEKELFYRDPYATFNLKLKPGIQHLNGAAALRYVRYRGRDGDIGRIRRQQHFLLAAYEKMNSPQLLLQLPGLSKQLFTMIETDLSLSDMVELGRTLLVMMQEKKLLLATVPGTPEYIEGVSYWLPDVTDLRHLVDDMQGAQVSDEYATADKVLTAKYQSGTEQGKKAAIEDADLKSKKPLTSYQSKSIKASINGEKRAPEQKKEPKEDIKKTKKAETVRQLHKKEKTAEKKDKAHSPKYKGLKKANEKTTKKAVKKRKIDMQKKQGNDYEKKQNGKPPTTAQLDKAG